MFFFPKCTNFKTLFISLGTELYSNWSAQTKECGGGEMHKHRGKKSEKLADVTNSKDINHFMHFIIGVWKEIVCSLF